MAKNHAPSLLFSVIVHILAGLILYVTYQTANSFTKEEKQETLICVSLSTYEPAKVQKKELSKEKIIQKTSPKKKTQKKTKKTIVRKIIKKPEPVLAKQTVVASKVIKQIPKSTSQILPSVVQKTVEKELVVVQEINASKKIQKISPQKEYVDKHLEKIQELLQDNLYYPRRARKRGIVGTVVMHFEITIDGEVTRVEPISSPHEILSRAAIKTIKDLSGKFPKPNETLFLKIPIAYKLNR